MLISFIVPLYNCGPYIARCLDSILRQGVESCLYEVIIVDDGSTDNGPEIAQRYVYQHSNFSVIHQNNQGAGSAKNTGILAAKGDYVLFLDSDDWLVDGAIKHIISNTQLKFPNNGIDIISFELQHVLKSNINKCHFYTKPIYYTGTLTGFANQYGLRANCTNMIVRAALIKDIPFKHQAIAEDFDFMARLYNKHPLCKVIAFSSPLYCYYIRQGSATNNVSKDFVKKSIQIYCDIFSQLKKDKLLDGYDKYKVDYYILTFIQCMAMTRILSANLTFNEIKHLINKCHESGMLPIRMITSQQVRLLACASKGYLSAWASSKLYRHIYLKYIK